jgi:hypothetical protein
MKHSYMNTTWRRLVAGLLISGVMPFLGVAAIKEGKKSQRASTIPSLMKLLR